MFNNCRRFYARVTVFLQRELNQLLLNTHFPDFIVLEELNWHQIKDGNKEAYSQMYIFYYKKLYNYGRKFTADEALIEDTTQEVLLDAWKNRERFENIRSPHTYLFTAFRYGLFRNLKKQARQLGNVADDMPEPAFGAEHMLILREQDAAIRQRLEEAIAKLTPRQREAIFLRFYEGLPYEDVAEVLDVTIKASYKIVARAILSLKEYLNIWGPAVLLALREMGSR